MDPVLDVLCVCVCEVLASGCAALCDPQWTLYGPFMDPLWTSYETPIRSGEVLAAGRDSTATPGFLFCFFISLQDFIYLLSSNICLRRKSF